MKNVIIMAGGASSRMKRSLSQSQLSEDEKKQVSFWLMNRYVSSVKGNRDKQELAVFKTNEYYNKNYMEISKHPKLQWQLFENLPPLVSA